jgi:hypothetical protein
VSGWAAGEWARRHLFTYPGDSDGEPPYAVVDAWEPPYPRAVPADLCGRLVAAAEDAEPHPGPNGDYRLPDLDPADEAAVLDRFRAGNSDWWRLDLDRWDVMAKLYRPGDRHAVHQDAHPGAARRKFAGSVQLSEPGDYAGGDLVVHFAGQQAAMPRTRGALVAFPGWTVHEVEEVTAGERWALVVNGWGPPYR